MKKTSYRKSIVVVLLMSMLSIVTIMPAYAEGRVAARGVNPDTGEIIGSGANASATTAITGAEAPKGPGSTGVSESTASGSTSTGGGSNMAASIAAAQAGQTGQAVQAAQAAQVISQTTAAASTEVRKRPATQNRTAAARTSGSTGSKKKTKSTTAAASAGSSGSSTSTGNSSSANASSGSSTAKSSEDIATASDFTSSSNISSKTYVDPDSIPDEVAQALKKSGSTLRGAYDYAASLTYYRFTADPSKGTAHFAHMGFSKGHGNCYVMAAVFTEMAQALGYEARQIYGKVPLRKGGMGPHSWVEIKLKGKWHVFDPNFTNETGKDGYNIYYGKKGTWRYNKTGVMPN